ncbi:MAG: hypothetical protein IPM37_20770 [Hahellaceae bacterium]|nr:hypothetical protein [Hahellaceae bacterium]
MLMLDGMLAVASVCLFLAGCLLFAGSKLTRWYADLGAAGNSPDFSLQILSLLVAAVVVGLLPTPELSSSDEPDLNRLPPPAAGAVPSSSQRIAQWAAETQPGTLSLPPTSAHYELMLVAGNEEVVELVGSLDILADNLNRYYVVVETQAYGLNGPESGVQLSTGTLERQRGQWYVRLDAGVLPDSFPSVDTPIDLQVEGDRLILGYEQAGTRYQQIWQQFPDS